MALVVLSGLPGSGKTELARGLAVALDAGVISVDTIERGLRRAGISPGEPTGLAAYGVAQALAGEQLALGLTVVADAVNVAPEARNAWRELARASGADLHVVEVICSDATLHRQRVERRHVEPTVRWPDVLRLEDAYEPWGIPTVVLDTAATDVRQLVREALQAIVSP